MKAKMIVVGLLVLSVSGLITSCKKYPEGPGLSLRSKTARVANTWKLVRYTLNGSDQTASILALMPDYTEVYDKEGNYSYSFSGGTGTGKWEFQNDKNEIKRSGVSGQATETMVILKLKENEFWYYYMDGNDRNEFHFEEK